MANKDIVVDVYAALVITGFDVVVVVVVVHVVVVVITVDVSGFIVFAVTDIDSLNRKIGIAKADSVFVFVFAAAFCCFAVTATMSAVACAAIFAVAFKFFDVFAPVIMFVFEKIALPENG